MKMRAHRRAPPLRSSQTRSSAPLGSLSYVHSWPVSLCTPLETDRQTEEGEKDRQRENMGLFYILINAFIQSD